MACADLACQITVEGCYEIGHGGVEIRPGPDALWVMGGSPRLTEKQ
jgi:hypothetical protein